MKNMICKIKENNTTYIHKCHHCKSWFGYDIQEWAKDTYRSRKGRVECPYCQNEDKIKFKIRYKSSKKNNIDYKNELANIKENNKELKNEVKELESVNFDLRQEVNSLKKMESLYDEGKRSYEKLRSKYNNLERKIDMVNTYISDYMKSDKRNNLATKYLKEIQELSKLI